GERGADPGARADAVAGRDAAAARHRRAAAPVHGARPPVPGARSHARAPRPAAPRAARRAAPPAGSSRNRRRSAHRDHAGCRPAVALRAGRLELPQSADRATMRRISIPGDAATPSFGAWKRTRPAWLACGTSFTTRGSSFASSSFVRAISSFSPVTFGTTPCSGLPRKRVTVSCEEGGPFFGYCARTISGRWRALSGLYKIFSLTGWGGEAGLSGRGRRRARTR